MTSDASLLLGIDGGGTQCRARLCSSDGTLLGEGRAGPANVRLGVDLAFASVLAAARRAAASAGLDETSLARTHAGLGLAGVNLPLSFQEAETYPLPFARTTLETDTEIARLGAHLGGDGGIVIAGTGSCAEGRMGGRRLRLGGWGFALGDQGSGAAIGRAAIRHSLLAHDGLIAPSALARAVSAHFEHGAEAMVRWAETARPSDYAAFCPLVLTHADMGDPAADQIVQVAATAIERLILGLAGAGVEPIALSGGLAEALSARLSREASAWLIEPGGTPLDGALILARAHRG